MDEIRACRKVESDCTKSGCENYRPGFGRVTRDSDKAPASALTKTYPLVFS
jgi:hypothetical protein